MKIEFNTSTIQPMFDWLLKAKEENIRDEDKLRQILKMDDYGIEFARYGDKNLPVCTISFEEAVDFFMNFDRKTFTNVRLDYKQKYFEKFYANLEENMKLVDIFNNISEEDKEKVGYLLENGLPDKVLGAETTFTILLTISIGNSMGWPYKNYIHFDVANLSLMEDKESFLHVIAHEIHHTKFGELISDNMTPKEMFFTNFAFEGLAVYYNNNAKTKYVPSKYLEKSYLMDQHDWAIYDNEFDELFNEIKTDALACEKMTEDEVMELISNHYEQFDYVSLKTGKAIRISQFPTYYMGCYMWGIIDLTCGKEDLYDVLANPSKFIETYNFAVKLIGNRHYYLQIAKIVEIYSALFPIMSAR